MAHIAHAELRNRPFWNAANDPLIDEMADIVSVIGCEEFDLRFSRMCNRLVRADHFSTYIFPNRGAPKVPVVASVDDSATPATVAAVADTVVQYVRQDWANDPMLAEFRRKSRTFLREHHARAVHSPEQRQHYFDRLNIASVVCLLGQVGRDVLYLSFYMPPERAGIRDDAAEAILHHANLLFHLSHRHDSLLTLQRWRSTLDKMSMGGCADENAREVFKEILLSRTLLSLREADICALSLMGYSMEAIGMICEITHNTVATHRKRGFAKLGISSVNELFATIRILTQDV